MTTGTGHPGSLGAKCILHTTLHHICFLIGAYKLTSKIVFTFISQLRIEARKRKVPVTDSWDPNQECLRSSSLYMVTQSLQGADGAL